MDKKYILQFESILRSCLASAITGSSPFIFYFQSAKQRMSLFYYYFCRKIFFLVKVHAGITQIQFRLEVVAAYIRMCSPNQSLDVDVVYYFR